MDQSQVRHPTNLLETEVGQEVRDLLAHSSLQLTSGHQAWLLMAILYLVERERRKALSQRDRCREEQGAAALLRVVAH